jgi:mono/diheme cytochrome c family protein
MSKPVRFAALLLSSLLGLLALAVLLLNRQVEARLARTYTVPDDELVIPADPAAVERGRHLVGAVYLCELCHGEDLGGQLQFNDPLSGQIVASNLTSGRGGVGASFSPADWERAIRHGIDPQGRPLIDMPSNTFYQIGDPDLGAIIAYLRSLPPVDRELPERRLGLFYRLAVLLDPSLIPAEVIDHGAPRPPEVSPGLTPEYGRYLTRACTICHGEDLAGGPSAGAGLDLTRAGDLADWTEEQFRRALRTGERPRGADLDPALMPWQTLADMTDEELSAIWLYLQTLEAAQPQG